jgi:hypothetical protein
MEPSRAVSPRVRRTVLPAGSGLAAWYDGADLADAYRVVLQGPGPHGLRRLADIALGEPAPWFRAAIAVRDALVRPFGIATSADVRHRLVRDGRERIDFFPILQHSEREIVVGEDDRHLDFRVSLLLTREGDGRETLTATTVARCHGRLGRIYLMAIGPGHVLTVRSALRRAASAG